MKHLFNLDPLDSATSGSISLVPRAVNIRLFVGFCMNCSGGRLGNCFPFIRKRLVLSCVLVPLC